MRYTESGHILIQPHDDLDKTVDWILETDYSEEFCLALGFDPVFIASLMTAGFLVMSIAQENPNGDPDIPAFILLPKLHLVRSVLFFSDLHIKRSLKPRLSQYELRVNTDFDFIVDRCIAIHGDAWLTEPLIKSVRLIRESRFPVSHPASKAHPISFGVYRDGVLRAGEFGVLVGGVYTSYSGYYDEDSAGTVQIILMTHYLRDKGFSFLDLGMPLDYKVDLGAVNINPHLFVKLFRTGRDSVPNADIYETLSSLRKR
ncbi:MAG: GNAT family N-acetyltransferase [Spirochaetaceae bacterium]|jgi:Leu/Phe-tRNA-protein transferase|nr:GNAT family N-acetyltransferase [Spirochaetaceae bacterium]